MYINTMIKIKYKYICKNSKFIYGSIKVKIVYIINANHVEFKYKTMHNKYIYIYVWINTRLN